MFRLTPPKHVTLFISVAVAVIPVIITTPASISRTSTVAL